MAIRFTGILRTWNDDRGFGFIAPTHGGPELFVHISALPQDGTRPTAGERVTYETGRGKDGKPQAVQVVRSIVGDTAMAPRSRTGRVARSSHSLSAMLVAVLLVAGMTYGFNRYKAQQSITRSLSCDGRTLCSQMTSCTEARWFLKNCPGTRMDGNHDGTPCEQQWCTGPLAK